MPERKPERPWKAHAHSVDLLLLGGGLVLRVLLLNRFAAHRQRMQFGAPTHSRVSVLVCSNRLTAANLRVFLALPIVARVRWTLVRPRLPAQKRDASDERGAPKSKSAGVERRGCWRSGRSLSGLRVYRRSARAKIVKHHPSGCGGRRCDLAALSSCETDLSVRTCAETGCDRPVRSPRSTARRQLQRTRAGAMRSLSALATRFSVEPSPPPIASTSAPAPSSAKPKLKAPKPSAVPKALSASDVKGKKRAAPVIELSDEDEDDDVQFVSSSSPKRPARAATAAEEELWASRFEPTDEVRPRRNTTTRLSA